MRYFNKDTRSEAIPGIHFKLGEKPSNIVPLPESNPFFLKLEKGMEIGFGNDGVPCNLVKKAGRTPEQIASDVLCSEVEWVSLEISVADIEINKHQDRDPRATATEAAWRAYRCQLRDYVKGGQIVGERPVRPV